MFRQTDISSTVNRGSLSFFECSITFQIVRMLEQDIPSPACEVCLCPHWSMGTVALVVCSFWSCCTSDGTPPVKSAWRLWEGSAVLATKFVIHLFPFSNVHRQVHLYDRSISLFRSTQWMDEQARLADQDLLLSATSWHSLPCSVQGELWDFQSNYKWPGWKDSVKPATVINSRLGRRDSSSKEADCVHLHPAPSERPREPDAVPWSEDKILVSVWWVQVPVKPAVRSSCNKLATLWKARTEAIEGCGSW